MSLIDICNLLEQATCQIIIENDDGVVSAGSGVLIEDGTILTAKHVLRKRTGEAYQGATRIKFKAEICDDPVTYQTPEIDTGMAMFIKPFRLDLAQITPSGIPDGMIPLRLAQSIARRGTEVLMAGYTDDVPLPLDFEKELETMNPDMSVVKKRIETHNQYHMRSLMIKRAIVGCVHYVNINEGNPTTEIHGASYVLDNDLTSGGSGGPVVNLDGELLAIVIRKGLTSAGQLGIRSIDGSGVHLVDQLFSGSGLALSHELVTRTLEIANSPTQASP